MSSSPAQTDPTEPGCGRPRRAGLLAALAAPAMHGGLPVTVRETHASWVFLAGERAYKVKKPVALGFLDYRTLERRRDACREEVRVNRELAPGIYLGVLAIVAAGERFELVPDDAGVDAVEFAVEMCRFDESDTLAGLIASGGLAAEHLDAVAGRIADFHRAAPVADGGGAEPVLDLWRRNVRELRAGHPGEPPIGSGEDFAETFVALHRQEIERRRAAGLVRDGHGDLRCEHVLVRPSVRVVDRIEFDVALRHADIGSDLAFLTMDLEALGQRWAAERLLSGYRRAGMDAGGDQLLSFFAAHRALVRRKVALIAAAEHDGERSAALVAQAGSMGALAERLCWRARGPLALVVCGPGASGKSTLAAELSRHSGLAIVSSDAVRKSAAGLPPSARAGPELYSASANRRTYELLARRAQGALARGDGVIIDATCRSRRDRSILLEGLERCDVPRLVVRCEIPLAVAHQRARQRMSDPLRASDADPAVVTRQYRSFEPLDELQPRELLGLDAALPLDAQAELVTGALDRLLRLSAACRSRERALTEQAGPA